MRASRVPVVYVMRYIRYTRAQRCWEEDMRVMLWGERIYSAGLWEDMSAIRERCALCAARCARVIRYARVIRDETSIVMSALYEERARCYMARRALRTSMRRALICYAVAPAGAAIRKKMRNLSFERWYALRARDVATMFARMIANSAMARVALRALLRWRWCARRCWAAPAAALWCGAMRYMRKRWVLL